MEERAYSAFTDLALEIQEMAFEKSKTVPVEADGIVITEEQQGSLTVTRLKIVNEAGERLLGRPQGTYTTVQLERQMQDGDPDFESTVFTVAKLIGELLPSDKTLPILVAGLGNTRITPDGLGPMVTERVLVTRHITEAGSGEFADLFRSVSVIRPGVLGQTGVESAEMVKGVVDTVAPAALVVVDALSARKLSRLGCTIQISDTGIRPGAGIGNHRQELSQHTIGVPVISIGVPTVISAATLVSDVLEEGCALQEPMYATYKGLFVTPKDVDLLIQNTSVLLGYAINAALQPDLSLQDMRYYNGN